MGAGNSVVNYILQADPIEEKMSLGLHQGCYRPRRRDEPLSPHALVEDQGARVHGL